MHAWAFAFFVLVVFSGSRSVEVGTDSQIYLYKFLRIQNFHQIFEEKEIGHSLLCWLGHKITDDYFIIFLLSSMMYTGCLLWGIRRYSVNALITMFVFIAGGSYTLSFNITRQAIAVAIIFLAIGAIYQKNVRHFIVYVTAATLFHKSALFVMPTYFFIARKNTPKLNFCIFILGVAIIFFFDQLMHISSIFEESYAAYTGYKGESIGLVSTLYLVSLCIFFLVFKHRVKINRIMFEILLNMFLIGVSICVVSLLLGLGASGPRRLSIYFTISNVLLWPIVFQNLNKREMPLFAMSFVPCYLLYFYMTLIEFLDLIPYRINPILY